MLPLVVRLEDIEEGRVSQFAFLKSPVRIGRGELNDLQLDRPFVSTYHGLVQFDDEGARYVDLGSTNGSILEDTPLDRNTLVAIPPGAEVAIGSYRLRFERRVTSERPAIQQRVTAFAERASTMPPAEDRIPEGDPPPQPAPIGMVPPAAPEEKGAGEKADRAEAEAVARADAAIDEASLDLDLQYMSYRGSFEHLQAAVEGVVAPLSGRARTRALERLLARYPALAGEAKFAPPPSEPGASAPPVTGSTVPRPFPGTQAGTGDIGTHAVRMLQAFGQSYLPGDPVAVSPEEIEKMLGRAAGVLETFARSFLELRRGYEEFGREMGVRTVQDGGPLNRAPDARKLLEYLLDPAAQGRDAELQRAFADFMIHQVALLRGVVEGAQALLAELSPEAIGERAPSRPFTLRAAELWKAYEERYHEITDEDAAVSDLLFGAEFARAYAAMSGETGTGKPLEE
jgi:type VI secretion system protein ImpI